MKFANHILFYVVVWMLPLITYGQILGPGLTKREIKIGSIYKCYHRTVVPYLDQKWAYTSAFVQYGMFKWIALSIEACTYDYNYENDQYRNYIVGTGFISSFLKLQGFRLAFSVHYCENFSICKSKPNNHQLFNDFIGEIQIDRDFQFNKQQLNVWVAPAYVYDKLTYWPIGFEAWSASSFGFAFGANALLLKHFEPFVHFVYADFLQPRIGMAIRF